MSNVAHAPDGGFSNLSLNEPAHVSRSTKNQRVLACTLCQQRKVKCDRRFPCANCVKSRAQCVPATLVPRQRRRRFTERALLDRLRKYEDLLRQNRVPFEPLHSARTEDEPNADIGDDSQDEQTQMSAETAAADTSAPSTTAKYESGREAKNVFHAMSKGFRDPDNDSDSSDDDLRETLIKTVRDQEVEHDQSLLFGLHAQSVALYTLHPDPIQIFRLWQVYTENVNPLLKVTHIPSLQPLVIQAASNVLDINPSLEALMFSMYCVAVLSLTGADCQTMFGSSKEALLSKYQSGCRQALWDCGFLRTNDRDCLTAFFLYLISIQPYTSPQSLSAMLGIAIRIAQRIGIDSELVLAKCTVFEAEMRRRLWWPLMLFDVRMAQLAFSSTCILDPTWNCKIPLNVNDTDLRPDMKAPPATRGEPTDSVFTVVRSEMGDFIRNTTFHLEFANPALKPMAKHVQNGVASDGSHLVKLEEMIHERYFKFFDQENPLHFMATWTVRSQLATYDLLVHNLRLSSSTADRTEAQYDAATASAIRRLECDTKLMTSPLTKGFSWLNAFQFPFPGYYHLAQELRRRPASAQAEHAWEAMSDNWAGWFGIHFHRDSRISKLFSKIILQTWEDYKAAHRDSGHTLATPRIVLSMREPLAQAADFVQDNSMGANITMNMGMDESSMSMSMPAAFSMPNPPYGMGMQNGYAWMNPGMSSMSDFSAPGSLDMNMNQMDWSAYGGWPTPGFFGK